MAKTPRDGFYQPPGETVRRFHLSDAPFRLLLGPFGCIAPETEIVTPSGCVAIADLAVGDKVLSLDINTGEFVHSYCTGGVKKGAERLYRIKTTLGEWRAAGHHRVLDAFGSYQRVDSLKSGQGLKHLYNIVPILSVSRDRVMSEYWDTSVIDTNNYVTADGTVHHNSGKTTACLVEYLIRANKSPPDRDGVRRSRCAVIRNRISDLDATTIKSWNEIFEPMFGKVQGTPTGGGFVARWRKGLGDGTTIDAEARFFPYDSQNDVKRLLGSEYTFAFLNEVRELPASLMRVLPGRLRYPNPNILADGFDQPWHGIWGDTNAPEIGSFIHKTFANPDKIPPGWELYKQPGGVIRKNGLWVVNPRADNIKNLRPTYYQDSIAGQPDDVIRVNYGNEYGFVKSGKLICPSFSDNMHVARHALEFDPDIKLVYVGFDFGSTPAAAFMQQDMQGRWFLIKEVISEKKPGIRDFAKVVIKPMVGELKAQGYEIVYCGDPAGNGTSQTDGDNCFDILAGLGIDCEPAYSNSIQIRAEVVDSLCRELSDGKPRFMVSPTCEVAIAGFAQKYVFAALNKAGSPEDVRYEDKPKKDGNATSHICDAVQYAIMGSGYGEEFTIDRTSSRSGPLPYVNRNVA